MRWPPIARPLREPMIVDLVPDHPLRHVPDPYYGGDEDSTRCTMLDQACDRLIGADDGLSVNLRVGARERTLMRPACGTTALATAIRASEHRPLHPYTYTSAA